MFEQAVSEDYAGMVPLEDNLTRRAQELDRYRCTSVDDRRRRCQLVVRHRYDHAVMIAAASYLRWGDDGAGHAERDDRPGWVRPEGPLAWAVSFPRVED